ncbi:HTH domain-containing protein [Peptococcus simiae]|uniref:HTH domain-containing protein n=1 Tax=Peptococcus simiae TaxID=1643805 RepID=UPI00397F5FB2
MVAIIEKNPDVTPRELSSQLKVSVSTIERDLKKLTAAGRIAYIGTAKTGHWQVLG